MQGSQTPHAGRLYVLCVDGLFQFDGCHTDPFGKFLGIQPPDRMFDDQKLRIRLARLCLRSHKRQEGFGDDDVGFNAPFFEFDTVMETPRRARPSIR